MKEFIELEIGAAKVMLLAEKAMYWPERKLLFIADIHFGKAAAYRALGQPVPAGTTLKNLQRLDTLLYKYPTTAIVFLGDFLHAPESGTGFKVASPSICFCLYDRRHSF